MNKLAEAVEKIEHDIKQAVELSKKPYSYQDGVADGLKTALAYLRSALAGGAWVNASWQTLNKDDCACNDEGNCTVDGTLNECPCNETIADSPDCPAFVWKEKT